MSQIRNAVIARVFRELDLIEQWGSGIPGVFHEAKKLNLPEPEIIEIGMRVRFTVYLAESLVLSPEQSRNVPKTYPEQQVTQQVTQQVKRLLNIMDGEMSRVELMQSVNLKDRVSFSKNYLEPALDADLIEKEA